MLAKAARAVHDRDEHDVVLVVAPGGARHRADAQLLSQVAAELGCPFVEGSDLGSAEMGAAIAESGAEVGISVNWPTIVPRRALDAFAHGVLNAHAGDLPRYRGNATLGWAILSGEPEMVVTVHVMDEGLDTGPVLAKRAHPIDSSTYVGDLFGFCEEAVPEMFVEVLSAMVAGTLRPAPQDPKPEVSLRCFPRTPRDGWMDWSDDAESLARLVRASSEPLDGAYTVLDDKALTIWRAHGEQLPYDHLGIPGQVVEIRRTSGEVVVLAGSGTLVLEQVQLAGAPPVLPSEVLGSTRQRLGVHVPTLLADLARRLTALEQRVGQGP
jgi:UDP-4-amino-4-deoxy-L-arabinose formyltransferase/UDP-glucuronic acid dehydrogenase (UDP-4-keto-hexauronic acid decarboxylating)